VCRNDAANVIARSHSYSCRCARAGVPKGRARAPHGREQKPVVLRFDARSAAEGRRTICLRIAIRNALCTATAPGGRQAATGVGLGAPHHRPLLLIVRHFGERSRVPTRRAPRGVFPGASAASAGGTRLLCAAASYRATFNPLPPGTPRSVARLCNATRAQLAWRPQCVVKPNLHSHVASAKSPGPPRRNTSSAGRRSP